MSPSLEVHPLLDRREQLGAVEVPIAEVPAEQRSGDELALAHRVRLDVVDRPRQQPVQRPAVRVHRAERQALVHRHLGRVRVEHLRELGLRELRALRDLVVDPVLDVPVLSEQPPGSCTSCRRSRASPRGTRTSPARGARWSGSRPRRARSRRSGSGRRGSRSGTSEYSPNSQTIPNIMKMFHSSGTPSGNVEVMWVWKIERDRDRDHRQRPAVGDQQQDREAELERRPQVGRRGAPASMAGGCSDGPGRAASWRTASGSRACSRPSPGPRR